MTPEGWDDARELRMPFPGPPKQQMIEMLQAAGFEISTKFGKRPKLKGRHSATISNGELVFRQEKKPLTTPPPPAPRWLLISFGKPPRGLKMRLAKSKKCWCAIFDTREPCLETAQALSEANGRQSWRCKKILK